MSTPPAAFKPIRQEEDGRDARLIFRFFDCTDIPMVFNNSYGLRLTASKTKTNRYFAPPPPGPRLCFLICPPSLFQAP
jgi:hypothetical protein